MAVTTATLRYGVIGNTTDFGSVIGESDHTPQLN